MFSLPPENAPGEGDAQSEVDSSHSDPGGEAGNQQIRRGTSQAPLVGESSSDPVRVGNHPPADVPDQGSVVKTRRDHAPAVR